MDLDCYVIESHCESVDRKLSNTENSLAQINDSCSGDKQEDCAKDYKTPWEESVERSRSSTKLSPIHGLLSSVEVKNFSDNSPREIENSKTDNTFKEPQKGRASLVRLQAVQTSDANQGIRSTLVEPVSRINSVDSSCQGVTQLPVLTKSFSFSVTPGGHSEGTQDSTLYSTTSEETQESELLPSASNFDGIPSTQEMQRFLTSDGQYVYGYKDSSGEFQFFYPTMNDRESHNEKERKRRSRVSEACGALRKLVPGLNEKTDKASVFEQAARYLKFLRNKYGNQFDQVYCEKYFLERS